MLSELQTNVCVVNHLSGTRAEKRGERKRRVWERWSTKERHREETVRDGRGLVGGWWRCSRPARSLFMDLNQPWDWSRIPNTDTSPYLLLVGSPHLSIPALLISTEQVSKATLQEVRGQVWCRAGRVCVWTCVHLDEWHEIIRYQSDTTSGVRDRAREC